MIRPLAGAEEWRGGQALRVTRQSLSRWLRRVRSTTRTSPRRLASMRFAALPLVITLATPLLATTTPAQAEDDILEEIGVTYGFGQSDRENVQIVPAYVHAGLRVPELLREPLATYHFNFLYAPEGWVAGITGHEDRGDAVEFGVNPIAFKITYDRGQSIVPYLTGGVGVMYTSLEGINAGGPFQFNETFGLGVMVPFLDGLKLAIGYRYRHMSNASIYKDNSGLNTHYGMLGLIWTAPPPAPAAAS